MANFEHLKRDSGEKKLEDAVAGVPAADEIAKITEGLPQGFILPIKSRKETLADMIQKNSDELTRLEIEELYFRRLQLKGGKTAEKAGQLLQLAVAKSREKKDFVEYLCGEYNSVK